MKMTVRAKKDRWAEIELDKRVHLPYEIFWTCNECEHKNCEDFRTDRYMSYPKIGFIHTVTFECAKCQAEKNLDIHLEVKISVTEV